MGSGSSVQAPPGFHVTRPESREEVPAGGGATIVHRGSGAWPEVALTFDDGPSSWTPEIAQSFDENGCRATFFMRGEAVAQRPGYVAELVAGGHEVGNHLWSHPSCTDLTRSELVDELARTADAIEAAGAPRPALARPPFFRGADRLALAAGDLGVEAVIMRAIGSSDWEAHTSAEVLDPILAHLQPGDIVCLHDDVSPAARDSGTRQPTTQAIRDLLPALRERGLAAVTVSQLLRE